MEQFGAGMITGWGAHHVDTAHWGMDTELTGPVEIWGQAQFPTEGLWNVHGPFKTYGPVSYTHLEKGTDSAGPFQNPSRFAGYWTNFKAPSKHRAPPAFRSLRCTSVHSALDLSLIHI